MIRWIVVAALALAAPSLAQEAELPTPGSVVAVAKPEEWTAIDAADLLVMELAPDAAGAKRTIVIQLMPAPFSQGWVGNIRMLAKAHWWDGTTVYRVVDNWVAQWGDGEDDQLKAKPLPEGLRVVPESEYTVPYADGVLTDIWFRGKRAARAELHPVPPPTSRLPTFSDPYSDAFSFPDGVPVAMQLTNEYQGRQLISQPTAVWPVHCYASVGVARNLSPDTGTGAELYAVIGHAPRQLDRNIAVVGRVIEGIEHLSVLPRGKGDAGVYDDPKLRVPILSVRLGDELAAPPRFEYLDTQSESFERYVAVRANRNDSFYKVPAGGIDVCNVQVPIRRVPAE